MFVNVDNSFRFVTNPVAKPKACSSFNLNCGIYFDISLKAVLNAIPPTILVAVPADENAKLAVVNKLRGLFIDAWFPNRDKLASPQLAPYSVFISCGAYICILSLL